MCKPIVLEILKKILKIYIFAYCCTNLSGSIFPYGYSYCTVECLETGASCGYSVKSHFEHLIRFYKIASLLFTVTF